MYPWTVSIDFFNRATDERGKSVRLVKRVIKRSMVPSNQSEKKKKKKSRISNKVFFQFLRRYKNKRSCTAWTIHECSIIHYQGSLFTFSSLWNEKRTVFKMKYCINCPTVSQTSSPQHTTKKYKSSLSANNAPNNLLSNFYLDPKRHVSRAFPKRNRTWRLRRNER